MANLAEAEKFLNLLDECADKFTFQTFDDDKHRKSPQLARWLHGDAVTLHDTLTEYSKAGAGVYVAVQEMDGNGRDNESVSRIRAIFQEDDGDGKPLPLEPHISVNSSPGKYHHYLLVDGLTVADFRAVMRVMVHKYGSDKNAQDPARVLRLPGFDSHKYGDPYNVQIVHESGGVPYTKEQIFAAFNVDEHEINNKQSDYDGGTMHVSSRVISELRSALAHMSSDDRDHWVRMGLALKCLGDVGRDLWVEWSARSNKWRDEDEEQWRSFEPKEISYKTVFKTAQLQGWINPMSNDAEPLYDPESDIFKKLKAVFAREIPSTYEIPDELVEELLIRNEISIIYGDSNSGKTFLAVDMACSIALGKEWLGRRVEQGLVVYLAAESPASIRLRVQAYEKFHRCSIGDGLIIVQASVNFHHSETDINHIIRLVEQAEEITGRKCELIVSDTLARISAGANENSGEDMGQIMARFDILKNATKAHLSIIHHAGKNQAAGARGWSGMRAHVDTEIEVSEKGLVRKAQIMKQRGLPGKGDDIYFKLSIVEMGTTKWGKIASTCVVEFDSEPAESESEDKGHAKKIRFLTDAWIDSGKPMERNKPYVSRPALKQAIEDNGYSSVRNQTMLFTAMAKSGQLEVFKDGWIVVDDKFYSQMMVLR